MLVAVLALLAAALPSLPVALAQPSAPAVLPPFSWATLPVFLHTQNSSGPWSAAALQRIAGFPLVTLEKGHNSPAQRPGHRLDKTAGAACAAIHAINPLTKVLYCEIASSPASCL